jgi:hypothetical protein
MSNRAAQHTRPAARPVRSCRLIELIESKGNAEHGRRRLSDDRPRTLDLSAGVGS